MLYRTKSLARGRVKSKLSEIAPVVWKCSVSAQSSSFYSKWSSTSIRCDPLKDIAMPAAPIA